MKWEEARQINQYLEKLSGKNLPSQVYIDNLHCPYFEFSQEYQLPPLSTTEGVDYESALKYLTEIKNFIPELLLGTQILPEPKPKKEIYKIFLVKKIQGFAWVLSLSVGYLGGSQPEKILKPKIGEFTPSILTNRIYFSSFVVPVEDWIIENNQIINFQPLPLAKVLETLPSPHTETNRSSNSQDPIQILPYSELFDDPEKEREEDNLRKQYGFNDLPWKLGSIYYPIGLEYGTFSFRFLEAQNFQIENYWQQIKCAFFGKNQFEIQKGKKVLEDYFNSFSVENDLSPSGNLRWKILRDSGNLLNLGG